MLAASLITMAIGALLMYAGMSGKGYWKQPWQPLINLFQVSPGK